MPSTKPLVSALFLILTALSAAGDIRGVAMSAEGAALPRASITAWKPESEAQRVARYVANGERELLSRTVTDAKGNYVLELDSKIPTAFLVIEKDGYVPASTFAANGTDIGALPLEVNVPTPMKLDGPNVAGARVIFANDGLELSRTVSDQKRIDIPLALLDGPGTVFVIRDGIVWTSEIPSKPRIDVPGIVEIRGTVASPDEEPEAGVSVLHEGRAVAQTNEEGAWSARVPGDWTSLTMTRDKRVGSVRKGQRKNQSVLIPAGSVTVTFTDSGHAPIAGALVVLDRETTFVTDSKGRVSVSELVPGEHEFSVEHPSFTRQSETVEIESGESRQLELTGVRTAILEGWVVDEGGRAVPAASVSAGVERRPGPEMFLLRRPPSSSRAWSDPQGRFVMPSTPPESVSVTGSKRGHPSSPAIRLTLEPGIVKRDVRITLPTGITVTGTVLSPEGAPLAGVEVSADRSEGRGRGQGRIVRRMVGRSAREGTPIRTDASGKFSLQLVEGEWTLTFQTAGYAITTRPSIDVVPRMEPLEITMAPGHDVRGRVVSSSGAGVADVRILMPESSGETVSGSDGSFVLSDLPEGETMLIAADPARSIQEMRIVRIPSDEVVIKLPPVGAIAGNVVDQDGEPVRSFQASASKDDVRGAVQVRLSVSGNAPFVTDDGSFVIENVPAGTAQIAVSAPGFMPRTVHGIEVAENEVSDEVEVVLDKGTTVTGKVTGPDGRALSGAVVSTESESSLPGPLSQITAGTNGAGEYELRNIPRGERTLTFSKTGLQSARRTVTLDDDNEEVDARLERGFQLSGTVRTSSGAPVAGAMVRAQAQGDQRSFFGGSQATTDDRGVFSIDGLSQGRYDVSAAKTGYVSATRDDLDMSSDLSVDLTLGSGGTITGRVTGIDPSAYPETLVTVSGRGGSGQLRGDGTFRIEGVSPGSATLVARSTSFMNNRSSEPATVEVVEGSEVSVDLVFSGDIVISGRVTRAGEPLPSGLVVFAPKGGPSPTTSPVSTDGKYEFAGLEPGSYDVSVIDMSTFGTFTTEYEVTRSDTFDIEIRGSSIEGQVVDSNGRPVESAEVTISPDNTERRFMGRQSRSTGADGRFRFDDVGEGSWTVLASRDGYGQDSVSTDVRTGSPAQTVTLHLMQASELIVRATDASTGRSVAAFLTLTDASGRDLVRQTPPLREDGTMKIEAAPGSYRLTARSGGLAEASQTVSIPGPPVQIILGRGGILEVTSRRPTSVSVRVATPGGGSFQMRLNPGPNSRDNLAPGVYTMTMLEGGQETGSSIPFSIREGETTRIDL